MNLLACPFSCGIVLLGTLLGGCATAPLPLDASSLRGGNHLVLLELPPIVEDGPLKDVMPDTQPETARAHIQQLMDSSLRDALKEETTLQVNVQTTPLPMTLGQNLSPVALAQLRSILPASQYLRVSVTDFGNTPEAWKTAYIGFEVVTTLAVAGLLYVHKTTRALAGIYLVEEPAEEFAEGYSGFWLLNRLSRPVRLDADLIDAGTGHVVWHESQTGMAGWEWNHLWAMHPDQQNQLLARSMKKAASTLVRRLESPSTK